MYITFLLLTCFSSGPRNVLVVRDPETQLRSILTLLQQLYYAAGRALCEARSETDPPSNLRHFLGHFNTLPQWISRWKQSSCRKGAMRVLALAKAYYPDIDVSKLMGGFPEFNLDKSKFDHISFQKIDRETRHAASVISSSLMLDSFQPSFDAKNKRIVEEDPEPFIVDVPRVPKDKGTDVSGSGTPAIPAPGRPEVEDDDLPFQTPLTAICWETKPKEVSLKTKGAKEVLIQEPRKDRGSPSKGAEVTKTTSTTADPGTTPGPN